MTAINHAVFVGTGARGVGKSTWAATYLPPSEVDKVFYIDSENSANSIRTQLQAKGLDFGHYVDLGNRFPAIKDDDLLSQIAGGRLPWVDSANKSALIGLYKYVIGELNDRLTPGKYRVVVIDTLEKLEAGMAAYVEADKKGTGWTISAYGKMWSDAVYPLYESLIAAIHARGVEVVILNSHLKTPWEGTRRIVGKVEPAGKPLLYKLSSLMLWFVNSRENADGAPAALVLKERLGQVNIVADEWAISRRLPERIPHASWSSIRRYLDNGADLAHPSEGERMTDAEKEMISELLSDQQMRLMVLEAEKEVAEASILPQSAASFSLPTSAPQIGNGATEGEALLVAANRETALRLIGEGKSKSEVASEMGMTLPEVIRLLK